MKTKIVFATLFMAFMLIWVTGQSAPAQPMDKTTLLKSGPPTFETTTSGLEIKVWVMTQEEHNMMMKQTNSQEMTDNEQMKMENQRMTKEKDQKKMDKDSKKNQKNQKKTDKAEQGKMKKSKGKSSTSATHHIKVDVTDVASGMNRNDVNAMVEVISPSKKSKWVDLKNMSDHYGQDLTLKEKGSYSFIIRIDDKGFRKSTQFNYTVE